MTSLDSLTWYALIRVQENRVPYTTNGVDFSNTYLLETDFGWTGILAEPARCWHKELRQNRTCFIDTNCVWKTSNSTLLFNETSAPELATINVFSKCDYHEDERKNGQLYEVETISLNDLLEKHQAPENIDYLSIDTEGSEFDILSGFDFTKHSFNVITCEHNYSYSRGHIHDLLSRNGYVRVHQNLSDFDDWYIRTPQ